MTHWYNRFSLSNSKNRHLLLWLAGALFSQALFIKFTSEVFEDEKIQNVDKAILHFIADNFRRPFLNGIAVDITALGSPVVLSILFIIVMGVLIIRKDSYGGFYFFTVVSGGVLWIEILKNIVSRPRPEIISHLVDVQGLSYPSGHSLGSTVVYLAIGLLLCRQMESRKSIFLILLSAALIISLICFSRLYLGVHYPSDVLSGVLFGLSWTLAVTAFFELRSSKKKYL